VKKAKSVGGFSLKIEVEARSEEEAEEAILVRSALHILISVFFSPVSYTD